MAAPRSRFLSTTHSLRAAIPLAGRIEGVARLAVNPVAEDADADSDRIHAVLADGSLSETALVAGPRELVVERRGGVEARPAWMVAETAEAFARALTAEISPELAAEAGEARRPARPAPGQVDQPGRGAPTEPRRVGPKARFRQTTVAVGLVRGRMELVDGMPPFSGFVVNPDSKVLDDTEDRVHAILPDGSVSEACLYCGRDGYAISSGDGVREEPDAARAAHGFVALALREVSAPSLSLH